MNIKVPTFFIGYDSKEGYFNSLVWKKPASLTEPSSSEIESNIIKYINN